MRASLTRRYSVPRFAHHRLVGKGDHHCVNGAPLACSVSTISETSSLERNTFESLAHPAKAYCRARWLVNRFGLLWARGKILGGKNMERYMEASMTDRSVFLRTRVVLVPLREIARTAISETTGTLSSLAANIMPVGTSVSCLFPATWGS